MNAETSEHPHTQKTILWIAYLLHALVLPAVIGLAINLIKLREYKRDAAAEQDGMTALLVSHHQWLLKTFLITVVALMVAIGNAYYGVGYLIGLGALLWWVYRIARGIIYMAEGKPLPGW